MADKKPYIQKSTRHMFESWKRFYMSPAVSWSKSLVQCQSEIINHAWRTLNCAERDLSSSETNCLVIWSIDYSQAPITVMSLIQASLETATKASEKFTPSLGRKPLCTSLDLYLQTLPSAFNLLLEILEFLVINRCVVRVTYPTWIHSSAGSSRDSLFCLGTCI